MSPEIKENKLDLAAIRAAGLAAQERIDRLPKWERAALKIVYAAATSEPILRFETVSSHDGVTVTRVVLSDKVKDGLVWQANLPRMGA